MTTGAPSLATHAGPWRLWHRHIEGGPWTVVAESSTAEGLREERRAGWRHWPVDPEPGDLARLDDPSGVRKSSLGLHPEGFLARLGVPARMWSHEKAVKEWAAGRPWEELWADCPDGAWMLKALRFGALSRKRLAEIACAFAEEGFAALPAELVLPREVPEAVDLARAWTVKDGDDRFSVFQRVRRDTARALFPHAERFQQARQGPHEAAVWLAIHALDVVDLSENKPEESAAQALLELLAIGPPSWREPGASAERVRQRVPLREVVLGMLTSEFWNPPGLERLW